MKEKYKIVLIILGLTLVLFISATILGGFSLTKTKTSKNVQKQHTTDTASVKPIERKAQKLADQYDYDGAIRILNDTKRKETDRQREKYMAEKKQLVVWSDPMSYSHLFFHSLIVNPTKALQSNQAQGYKDYMVTISEFKKILKQLYQRGYVLVSFSDMIKKDAKGNLEFVGVSLPSGKKPLILSEDDVNYYEYMNDSGFASNLMINKNNQVKNLYKENGIKKVGNYDVVPIVNEFVEKHPSFSYHGSKGVLAVTGYNGVLGYRSSTTQYGNNKTTRQAAKKAKAVANRLKETGWSFASHSWGHINFSQSSIGSIQQDTARYKSEVEPIIGKTNIFIFPFGADISDWHNYSTTNEKFDYLKKQGFDIFCNVDASKLAWGQFSSSYYRSARINVDGLRFDSDLKGSNTVLNNFFNVNEVIDKRFRSNR